jgi:NAD(P)-dependent dehydrogenase (short-subunit alcohol dehydrogenase family)
MANLQGKTALITGGAGGIGRATALEFANSGVTHLAIVDIDEAGGQETVKLVKAAGAEAIFVKADVSDAEQVQNYVNQTIDAFGRIDIFFNNAGIEGKVMPVQDYPVEEFDKVMAINVRGMYLGMKYVIPHMLNNGGGAIINTASVAGINGAAGFSAYVASKHATLGLTKTVAAEVAPLGIRVNAICPSPVDNRMMRSLESQANPDDPTGVKEIFAASIPAQRYGTNEEIAGAVAMLASDDADWIMGVALPADGGMTAV